MVSSDVHGLTKARMCRPIQSQLLFPMNATDVVPLDHVELDFSDVFGPLPVQTSSEMNPGDSGDSVSASDTNDLMYGDPLVIYSRSHSLVGPSTCLGQSLKLSKLTLHEIEDSEELVECVHGEAIKVILGTSTDDDISEKSVEDIDSDSSKVQTVGLEDFEVLKLVGQGAFGKVFQVRKRNTSEIYAMKVMRKDKIMEKNHAEYMKAERDILTKVDHPFVVQLRYSFQTKYRLYLVLDFVNGGHLFFQLYNQGLFREDLARIYAAEIVSAVSHLHANGIMHRDLKPENILLDEDGHAMLTDFGLAKEFDENTRSNSMCGTVEYMSPEICLGKGHDKAADWWSVGILLYEMLTGKLTHPTHITVMSAYRQLGRETNLLIKLLNHLIQPPFIGGNREKIQQKIIKDKIKLPGFLTSDAHSLLKGLLQKDPSKRLGSGRLVQEEIKRHKWFKPINWKKLEAREIQPSFRPEVDGALCVANFEKRWTDMPLADSPAASPKATGNIFTGFTYERPAASFLRRNNNNNNNSSSSPLS